MMFPTRPVSLRTACTAPVGLAASTLALLLSPAAPAAADWRADADARIAEHRMSDLTVRVRDARGNAVQGASVHVAMQDHAFGWGTVVSADRWTDPGTDPRYRENILRYFNRATIENGLKWSRWENNSFRPRTIQTVEDLFAAGLDVRGHTTVWQDSGTPSDVKNSNSLSYIDTRVRNHIADITGYDYANGVLDEWDVINENYPQHNLVDKFVAASSNPAHNFENHPVLKSWLDQANTHYDGGPATKTYINDYHILTYDTSWSAAHRNSYYRTAQALLAQGADLDAVGFQSHINNGSSAKIAPDEQFRRMELFADLGLELAVTEFDMYGGSWSEAEQADYLEQFVRVAFSHPAMQHFTMWGYWDGSHWQGSAPLFRENWTLKPSGERWLELVYDEWWTDTSGTTDTDGDLTVAGFHGDYRVSVEFEGRSYALDAELLADGELTFTLPRVIPEPTAAAFVMAGALVMRRRGAVGRRCRR